MHRKVQDPLNNLAEAATCRFSVGEYPQKHCLLIASQDAYHPKKVSVTRSDCLYCTQSLDLPRGPFSNAGDRAMAKRWWAAWVGSGRS